MLEIPVTNVVRSSKSAYRKLKRPIWDFEEVNLTPTYATNSVGGSKELFGGELGPIAFEFTCVVIPH